MGFALCRELGIADVDGLLAMMPATLLDEWAAFLDMQREALDAK